MTTQHFILIESKFKPATNTKGCGIQLTLPRWNKKRIHRAWDWELNGPEKQANVILKEAGITPAGFGESVSGYAFLIPFDQVEAVKSLFGV